ncbi:MAG: ATPase [Lachnospiraceae bacterium]|nr:ATPase [Lachnospiraceae bacterium]
MKAELERLDEQIQHLQMQLSNLPPGKLIITRNQARFKWYTSDGKKPTYITKAKKDYAEQLAIKKYLSLQLEELLQEQKAIHFYLRHHSQNAGWADQILNDSPYQNLLRPYFQLPEQELSEWTTAPFERNLQYPEHLNQKSFSGNIVRSKSEAIIDMALYVNKIPFRYECALPLGGSTVYPDFTILHPDTRKIFYWEHFGMMDQPNYYKSAYSKLQLYADHNIIPSINLVTTYETKEKPLSADFVNNVIKQYFL